jgi:hypothetical protein
MKLHKGWKKTRKFCLYDQKEKKRKLCKGWKRKKKKKKLSIGWKRKENEVVYRTEKEFFFLKLSNGWKRKKMELCERVDTGRKQVGFKQTLLHTCGQTKVEQKPKLIEVTKIF